MIESFKDDTEAYFAYKNQVYNLLKPFINYERRKGLALYKTFRAHGKELPYELNYMHLYFFGEYQIDITGLIELFKFVMKESDRGLSFDCFTDDNYEKTYERFQNYYKILKEGGFVHDDKRR
jgi:hypothetical protein